MMTLIGSGDAAAAAGIMALGLGILLAGFTVLIVILLVPSFLLFSAQSKVPPAHQRLSPGLSFLLAIPIAGSICSFFVFSKISDSYASYFASIGRADVGDAGKSLGMATSILWVVATFGMFVPIISCFAFIAGPASLIVFIIYLVKILNLKGQIQA